jgi:hypothetical protein
MILLVCLLVNYPNLWARTHAHTHTQIQVNPEAQKVFARTVLASLNTVSAAEGALHLTSNLAPGEWGVASNSKKGQS